MVQPAGWQSKRVARQQHETIQFRHTPRGGEPPTAQEFYQGRRDSCEEKRAVESGNRTGGALDVGEVAAKHAGAHPVVRHQPAGAGRHLRDRAGVVRMAGGRGADGWFRCCSCGVLCTARPDVNGHTSSLRASGCWLAHPLMRRSTAIPHLQECLQRAPGLGPQVAAKRFQKGRFDLSRSSEERMGLS